MEQVKKVERGGQEKTISHLGARRRIGARGGGGDGNCGHLIGRSRGWVPLAEQKSTRRRVEFFPLDQFQIHHWPRLVSAFFRFRWGHRKGEKKLICLSDPETVLHVFGSID